MPKSNSVEPVGPDEKQKEIKGRAPRTIGWEGEGVHKRTFDGRVRTPRLKMSKRVENYVLENVLSEIENFRR